MIREAIALLVPACAIVLLAPSLRSICGRSGASTAALALCLGIGLSSVTTTGLIAAGMTPREGIFVATDAAIWAIAGTTGWWLGWKRDRSVSNTHPPVRARSLNRLDWIVRAVFGAVVAIALGVVVMSLGVAPHGDWDAWAIWNLHARFLFSGGDRWRDLLSIDWSQPDYPLLLPASVARVWAYAGHDTTAGPAIVAIVFGVTTATIVMTTIGLERPRAWIAGALLAGAGSFLVQIPSLCADVPIACFMVVSLAAACGREGVLAGREASRTAALVSGGAGAMAAWTKNEGLVFVLVMFLLVAVVTVRRGAGRWLWWWIAGGAPMLAALAWFKLALAPPSWVFGQSPQVYVDLLLDTERHAVTASLMAQHLWHWGAPLAGIIPLLALAAVWLSVAGGGAMRMMAVVIALMFLSYGLAYLTTPFDIAWHVSTSFDRLLVQIWPALVLTVFFEDPHVRSSKYA